MPRPPKEPYSQYGVDAEGLNAITRRIRAAVAHHKKIFEDEVKDLADYYGGDQDYQATLPEGDHWVTINRVLPNIELKVNTVCFRKPEFIITPNNSTSEQPAKVAKAALAYYWRESDIQEECKRSFRDSKILRFGVVQIGWRMETEAICLRDERRPVEGDLPDPEEMARLASEGIDPGAQLSREAVTVDAPIVRRIKPHDLMFEPGADYSLKDARFIVWRERLPLDEIKANPAFNKKVVDKLQGDPLYGDELLDKETRDLKDHERPDDVKCSTLYHYYEKRRRLHCVYSGEDWKNELLVEKWPWQYDDYPFEIIVPHPVPDKVPGECVSDLELAKPLQDSLNQTRSLQQNHAEQFTARFQCRTGVLNAQSRRQMRQYTRGTVVEHSGADNQAIYPIQTPGLNPEIYQVEERSYRDMDYVLGVSDYQRNMLPQGGRRTATEVAALAQTGSARADNDIVEYSLFVARVARKVLALLRQFASHTRTVPIYDDSTNAQSFVDVTVDTIRGEYDLEVEIGSTQPINEEAEGQRALLLLQALTPFLQMVDPLTGGPVVNPVPLLRKIVEKSGIKNAGEIIGPAPAPMLPPLAAPPGTEIPPGAGPEMAPPDVAPDPMSQLAGLLSQESY